MATERPHPATLEECWALIDRLFDVIEAQQAQIQKLEARVTELETRLGRNSQNSSRPPSSDPPHLKLPPKKEPTGRKPGGQPGHKGSRRELLPPERVNEVKHHWPSTCEHCNAALSAAMRTEVGRPLRHQVVEVPVVKAHVTEHQLHSQHCGHCGHATTAELPVGVPNGAFGPRLLAVIALFTGAYRVSKRVALAALGDLFNVDMALGSVSAAEQVVSEALAPGHEEALAAVRSSQSAHADETGWRERRAKAWLWVLANSRVAVFMIHARRGAVAARVLIGTFAGTLVSDRWSAYAEWALAHRQLCWAHIKRDFQFIAEASGMAGKIGRKLLAVERRLFRAWRKVRDGTMTRENFARHARGMRQEVRSLLERGRLCGAHKVAGMCGEILKVEQALWTFVRVEGVEPTNNLAERCLRHCVLWRKSSFGTHSPDGSRFVERIMTAVATLKLQQRNVLDYLVAATEAKVARRSAPSLLAA